DMTTDSLDPMGLYFGTRNGVLYSSTDEGKSWKKILDGLPAVVCVKTVQIGEPRAAARRKPVRKSGTASAPVKRPKPMTKPRNSAKKEAVASRRGCTLKLPALKASSSYPP